MFCECLFAFSYLQNIRRYQQKNVHRSTQKALRNSPKGFGAAKQNLCKSLFSVGNPCTTVDFVAAYRKKQLYSIPCPGIYENSKGLYLA
jgi:hypothetical protein